MVWVLPVWAKYLMSEGPLEAGSVERQAALHLVLRKQGGDGRVVVDWGRSGLLKEF